MRHWEIQIDPTNLEVLVPAFEDLKKEPAAGPEADGVREVFDGLCGMLAVLQANSWSPHARGAQKRREDLRVPQARGELLAFACVGQTIVWSAPHVVRSV